ncbi:MAG: hypothetical protein HQ488_03220 [Parcubacteria group bacterium]|nr:hypothetical protein [Parcubacteria group bacterium]
MAANDSSSGDDTTSTDETLVFPFERAMLKLRINKTWVNRFTDAGLRLVRRTPSREDEIQAGHKDQRGPRHYLRLGNRTNAAGQDKGDSGKLRIEFNPNNPNKEIFADPAKAIRVDTVFQDFLAAGYVIADVHILKRDGEQRGMGFLVIVFREGVKAFEPSPACKQVMQDMFGRHYRSVFVWENPDDTCTINANMAIVGHELTKVTDARTLRFSYIKGEDRTRWASRILSKDAPFPDLFPAPTPKATQAKPDGPQPNGPAAA